MAVDVKQLRIGSHVELKGKRGRILYVSPGGDFMNCGIHTTDDRGLSANYHVSGFEQIHPIPLTPALLKELGFKYTDKGRIQSWWLDFFCLDHLSGKGYYNFGAIHLKYLHELESIYYLACGVELIKE